jgi:predicted Zn-dependent peptidase
MIISVAGNIKHEHIVELTNIYFKELRNENHFKIEPSSYHGGFSTTVRDIEQVHLVVGFKGFSYNDPEYYTGNLISIILGGGMSSRLFQEVREKRGLAYSVHSYTSCYSDNGIFGIYAASEEAKINELIDVIAEEVVVKLIDSVNDKELSRARTQIKAGLLMGQESCSNRADDLGRNYSCYGKYITPAEIITRIESITRDDINRTLKKILTNATPTVAAIGKVHNMYDYEKICNKFKL